MSNPINKKFADLFSRMDEAVLKMKINNALEMMKNGNTDDLAKKISKVDKQELIDKIGDFDKSKLADMNIDTEDLKKKISEADFDKMKGLIGEQGDEIIKKIRELIE